jgi:hypothetical protein
MADKKSYIQQAAEELQRRRQAQATGTAASGWPAVYVNADTGKEYKPHSEAEAAALAAMTPPFQIVRGGEGCLAADTVIDGRGYLADFPGAILQGRDDLYEVKTESGAVVRATLWHRFLTPTGWRQLRYLRAGDVIAAYETGCVGFETETEPSLSDRCCASFRQGGGLHSPAGLVALDRWRLLHKTAGGSSAYLCPLLADGSARSYRKYSSCPWVQRLWQVAWERLHHAAGDESARAGFHNLWQFLNMILQLDSGWQSPPWEDHISFSHCGESDDPVSSRSYQHRSDTDSVVPQSAQGTCLEEIGQAQCISCPCFSQDYSLCQEQGRFFAEHQRREFGLHPPGLQFPAESNPACEAQVFPVLSSCNHYTTKWTACQQIVYAGKGEYYDVEVPFIECYGAAGLIHHNSGKSSFGIIKDLERLRTGCVGILCCVDAHTIINGIPIAERTEPGLVNTLYGPMWASTAFCEGRADLFLVATQGGRSVTVTLTHRFLTPIGWRQLRDLRVGDLIVADDSEHGQNGSEIWPNSQDYYSSDLRPYGELDTPWAQCDPGRSLLPGLLGSCPDLIAAHRDRVCIARSFLQTHSDEGAMGPPFLDKVDRSGCVRYDVCPEFPVRASRTDNRKGFVRNPIVLNLDNDENERSAHCPWLLPLLAIPRNQQSPRFLGATCPHHIGQECVRDRISEPGLLDSYGNYTTEVRYVQIERISFQKYGDFYDLTVPVAGHYSAHGLFHHNSPDIPHLKKSLWPEFRAWCPWNMVVPSQRRRKEKEWAPGGAFTMNFINGAVLYCGGIDDPMSWEGGNVNFAHFDEARRKDDAQALKVLSGRVRIPGPNGEPPQLWITTTPRMNWLFDYFGPMKEDDPHADFKRKSADLLLLTRDNLPNLDRDYIESRASTLTEAERRVYLEAEWEEIDNPERFLPDMLLWDACQEMFPPLTKREPMILALDAGVSHDAFCIIGVTRFPDPHRRIDTVAVRYARAWQPGVGKQVNFSEPEAEIRRLCKEYNVVMVTYDPYQLVDMAQRLYQDRVAWFAEFSQQGERLEADRMLLDLIMGRRIAHDGNATLRNHINNADRKLDPQSRKLRIVKREHDKLIDLAVCLSMAAFRCLVTLRNL